MRARAGARCYVSGGDSGGVFAVMTRIFSFTSDPVALNSYLILGDERAVVVDTGSGPRQASRILTTFAEVSLTQSGRTLFVDLPVSVVNTHDHWDHFFGNATFARAGVTEFFASPQCIRDMQASAWVQFHEVPSSLEPDLPADPSELLVPMTEVTDGVTFNDLGVGFADLDVTARVLPGHTEGDLVLIAGHVALVGDLVEEGAPPALGDDATPFRWAQNLERLLEDPQVTVFAPGHGRPVDREYVAMQAEVIGQAGMEDAELAALPFSRDLTLATPGLPEGVARIL